MTPKLLTIPIIAALAFGIAACTPDQEVPTTPPTTPTDSTNAPVDGGNKGEGGTGGNFAPDEGETIYNKEDTPPEVTEDDIIFIGEKEGQANNSLFWEENSYGIDPEKIFVPKDVIDAFGEEQTDTLAQAVLASISEATTQSPLKAPYNKEDAPINAMLLNEFASKWLMGDAQNRFQQGVTSYVEGKEDEALVDTFLLYQFSPPSNQMQGYKIVKTDDPWEYYIDNLTIAGVESTPTGPVAVVTYTLYSSIPVVDGPRFNYAHSFTLHLDSGATKGDWLITDYSFTDPSVEGK